MLKRVSSSPLVPLVLFLLALFLRLRHIDTTGIWADQSFTLNTAMKWVNGGYMPLAANKSSVGFLNPPMIEYLYAVALRVWGDVLSVALLTMVSGLVAIGVTGWAVWRIFGRIPALWTLALFTLNPWNVYYSQLIWNQTMIPIFASLCCAWLIVYFAHDARPRYLVGVVLSAACLTQVHAGSTIQVITIALVCFLFWRTVHWRWLIASSALFIVTYIPYLRFQRSMGWNDLKVMGGLMGEPKTWDIASVFVSNDLLRGQGLYRAVPYVSQFDRLAIGVLIVSLIGCIFLFGKCWRARANNRQWIALLIVFLWYTLPILFYLRTNFYLQTYYLMGQIPAHFILMGVAIGSLQQGWRWGKWLTLPVVVLLGWQLYFNLAFQDHRAENGGFHTQIRHVRTTIETAQTLLDSYPECQLVAISDGHQVESSYLSLLWEFTEANRIMLTDGYLALPVPQPCAVYLDTLTNSSASQWVQEHGTYLPEYTLAVQDETWEVYLYEGGISAEKSPLPPPIHWTNGATLLDYSYPDYVPGTSLSLTTYWEITQNPPQRQYHVGAYLLSSENSVLSQHDTPAFDSIQWRKGDQFIAWFNLPSIENPPPPYQLALALYTWPTLERIDLTAGDNTAFLTTVTPTTPQ